MLGIIFLVWTLRLIMFKPFVNQVRSMRKMQEFAPEMKKIQKKYANDRQRQAQEMQKLQREHGFNPLGGCLPMLLQIPVFIGLFHVLREFKPGKTENYYFDEQGVASYVAADLFGARLSNWITQPMHELQEIGANRPAVIAVALPLAILAGILTHLTSRHSIARQQASAATPQTAIMNKVMLYLFPIGIPIGAVLFPFPIGLLIYWLANNAWTLMQQAIVYRKIDREEEAKKTAAKEKRDNLAPRPGQKPAAKKRPPAKLATPDSSTPDADSADAEKSTAKESGGDNGTPPPSTKPSKPAPPRNQKPAANRKPANNKPAQGGSGTEVPGLSPGRPRSRKSGRKNR
jgi:YidC/Oxa1 family membrane protein insertase